MDAILITDVSALTVFVMFIVIGGGLIGVGWALKCAVERAVDRGTVQSKSNHTAIIEQGGTIKKLTARLEAVETQLNRIEQCVEKRRR